MDDLDRFEEVERTYEEIVHETHATEGYSLLRGTGYREVVQHIAYEHHEQPDGSGYFRGTTELHDLALIVSGVEVYEALRADQTYRDSPDPLEAYGKLFDEFSNFEKTRAVLDTSNHTDISERIPNYFEDRLRTVEEWLGFLEDKPLQGSRRFVTILLSM